MNNKKMKKGMSMKGQRTLAYIVLVLLSFLCLFWFYVLFINATRSNGALEPGKNFWQGPIRYGMEC